MNISFANYWIHDLSPFLWQFPEPYANFGPGGIRWYGIAYLMGFLVAASLLKLAWKKGKSPYDQEQIMNLMTFQIVGVLLGGRVGYAILYSFEKFSTDPFIIFRVWEGGMSSHGGFLGVFIATLIYARISKQSPYPIGDLIVFIVPPGIFFGRIANFINGELWGRKTDLMWGVLFPKAPDFALQIARHPSQIYAAILEGILPFIYIQYRFWFTKVLQKPGLLTCEFLCVYAVGRIINEFFREPDATLILGMTRGQFYSIFLLLAALILFIFTRRISHNKKVI